MNTAITILILFFIVKYILPISVMILYPIYHMINLKKNIKNLGEIKFHDPSHSKKQKGVKVFLYLFPIQIILSIVFIFIDSYFIGLMSAIMGIGLYMVMLNLQFHKKYMGIYENGIVHFDNIFKWMDLHSWEIKETTYQIWTNEGFSFDLPKNDMTLVIEEILTKKLKLSQNNV